MSDSSERPLVTFAVLAYNQEKYIREAVEGAFAQTYEPLEIILSDDCSSDRTFEIMQTLTSAYKGSHRIRLNRNVTNLGIALHVSTVAELSSADIFVLAAGDDISLPYRTKVCVEALLQDHKRAFVETDYEIFTDCQNHKKNELAGGNLSLQWCEAESGIEFDLTDYVLNRAPALCGATRAIRLSHFKKFGPLYSSCPTEDTPSVLRLLMSGTGYFKLCVGLLRRKHELNLSSARSMEEMNFSEIREQYLRDIQTGGQLSLISCHQVDWLRNWANRTVERRVLRLQLSSGRLDVSFLLKKILPSRVLSLREKAYAARVCLGLRHHDGI